MMKWETCCTCYGVASQVSFIPSHEHAQTPCIIASILTTVIWHGRLGQTVAGTVRTVCLAWQKCCLVAIALGAWCLDISSCGRKAGWTLDTCAMITAASKARIAHCGAKHSQSTTVFKPIEWEGTHGSLAAQWVPTGTMRVCT